MSTIAQDVIDIINVLTFFLLFIFPRI